MRMKEKENGGIKTFLLTSRVLEPEIPAGATLVCVQCSPQNGNFIVYLAGGEPIFRRYTEQSDGKILLESLNRQYDSYTTDRAEMSVRGTIWVIVSFHKILLEKGGNRYAGAEGMPQTESDPVRAVEPERCDELLTFTEAGTLLKVKRSRLYAMLRSGELEALKVGKLWRISRRSMEKYLAGTVFQTEK